MWPAGDPTARDVGQLHRSGVEKSSGCHVWAEAEEEEEGNNHIRLYRRATFPITEIVLRPQKGTTSSEQL